MEEEIDGKSWHACLGAVMHQMFTNQVFRLSVLLLYCHLAADNQTNSVAPPGGLEHADRVTLGQSGHVATVHLKTTRVKYIDEGGTSTQICMCKQGPCIILLTKGGC